jgi:hypothetical protein
MSAPSTLDCVLPTTCATILDFLRLWCGTVDGRLEIATAIARASVAGNGEMFLLPTAPPCSRCPPVCWPSWRRKRGSNSARPS